MCNQRQLESSTTDVERVLQPPLVVHCWEGRVGWVSAICVPTCWPYTVARMERERRAANGNIVPGELWSEQEALWKFGNTVTNLDGGSERRGENSGVDFLESGVES